MPANSTLRQVMQEHGLAGRFKDYQPQLRVEGFAPQHWWICDGEVRVGLVMQSVEDVIELLNHDPFHSRPIEFPELYHAPTHPGDRITLAKWINHHGGTTSEQHQLLFDTHPDHVTVTFTEKWKDGRTGRKQATFYMDPDFGYAIHCEDELTSAGPEDTSLQQEYCNFHPRGVNDDRPEFGRRYPYLLWEHPSGKIIRRNQNNVGARAMGAMDPKGRRGVASPGFFGYFGENDYNIAVELLESEPGTSATTCPNLLDEHLCWLPVESDGPVHYTAAYNLVAVPPRVGEALNARAEMLDLVLDRYDPELEAWNHDRIGNFPKRLGEPYSLPVYPLAQGVVSDFETLLDPNATFWGLAFPYLEDTDDAIAVVSDCAHSGRRSLRVRVDGEWTYAGAIGGNLHVTNGQPYRLSAWIKTDLQEGDAHLAGIEFLCGPGNITGEHRTARLAGQTDWQPVAVEFTPGEKAHVIDLRFEVTGRGQAWIDDILLEKL